MAATKTIYYENNYMKIIRIAKKMRDFSQDARSKGRSIGFVPTMGALHQGHLSLIKKARKESDLLVVSIFVNPAQFGPKEDLTKYPRNFKSDVRLCKKAGVDVIFYPGDGQMYPGDYSTYVDVGRLSQVLCGKFRPGHFQGVATIVAKLFNIINPDIAYFGQKDAQQAIVIKKMVVDLNMPVRIKVMPTLREKGGLAMSSRNAYLTSQQANDARVLYQALKLAKDLISRGKRHSAAIVRQMEGLIKTKNGIRIQYMSIVDLNCLKSVDIIRDKVLIALAVYIGSTRLIDNIIVNTNIKNKNHN